MLYEHRAFFIAKLRSVIGTIVLYAFGYCEQLSAFLDS